MPFKFLGTILPIGLLFFSGAASAQTVVNGDFETVNAPPLEVYAPFGIRKGYIPPENGFDVINAEVVTWEGNRYFQGNSNDGDAILYQALATTINTPYTISFRFSNGDFPDPRNSVKVGLGDATPVVCPPFQPGFITCTATFTAQTNSDELRIYFRTEAGAGNIDLDDITISAPPVVAPSTPTAVPVDNVFALGALGALLAVLGARRAKSKKPRSVGG